MTKKRIQNLSYWLSCFSNVTCNLSLVWIKHDQNRIVQSVSAWLPDSSKLEPKSVSPVQNTPVDWGSKVWSTRLIPFPSRTCGIISPFRGTCCRSPRPKSARTRQGESCSPLQQVFSLAIFLSAKWRQIEWSHSMFLPCARALVTLVTSGWTSKNQFQQMNSRENTSFPDGEIPRHGMARVQYLHTPGSRQSIATRPGFRMPGCGTVASDKTFHRDGPSHTTTDVLLHVACQAEDTGSYVSYLQKAIITRHKKKSKLSSRNTSEDSKWKQVTTVIALNKIPDCHLNLHSRNKRAADNKRDRKG